MRFESGKFYRTRGGKKAFVAAVENPFVKSNYPIIGYTSNEVGCTWWTDRGRFCNDASEHLYDLISEWKDPVTVTKWLLLWSDNTTSVDDSPPSFPLSQLIAFKQVTITEGEGMQ